MGRRDYDDRTVDDSIAHLREEKKIDPENYRANEALDGEIFLQPRKSTKTYDHISFVMSPENLEKVKKVLTEELKFTISRLSHYAWDTEERRERPGRLQRILEKLTSR